MQTQTDLKGETGLRTDGLLIRAFQDDPTTEEKISVPALGVVHEVGPTSELRLTQP